MSEQRKSKESKIGIFFLGVINIIAGVFNGIVLKLVIEYIYIRINSDPIEPIIEYIISMIFMLLLFISLIIIHEAGHLIFGLISGYKFVSFRVGSLMLKKEKGKFVIKKFKLPGTLGQCLMMPDDNWNVYDYPYVLYNLGGVIANITVSLLSLVIFVNSNSFVLRGVCLMSFLFGALIAFNNGIPLRISGLNNDGNNALALKKDKEARRALYLQLYINGLRSDGIRIKDMPEEYFELPEDADLTNSLIAGMGAFKSDYLHDKMEFSKAKDNSLYFIENAPGLLSNHKKGLTCELIFYEMIGLCREEEIKRLYTNEIQKYVKRNLSYVHIRRLTYAYEIFVNHNRKAAKRELKEFEKAAKSYPFPGIIEAERELIKFIDNLAVIKNIEML